MSNNEEIFKSIKELILLAPDYWADVVAAKMGKKRGAIYYYANGQRGLRKGYHKDVLRYLTELINEEKKEALKLIANAQLAKGATVEDQPEETII